MKEEDDVLISRHLAQELDENEQTAFAARLAAEPDLARELEQRRREQTFLRTEATLPDLRQRMDALSDQYFKSHEKKARTQVQEEVSPKPGATVRRLGWRRWVPAAGIAAAVALVLVIWNPFASGDGYEQFADYAPIYLTEKSSDTAPAAAAAEAAFNAGRYAEAYRQLSAYLAQRPQDTEARLALGIAALETDRDGEAQTIFSDIASGTSALADDGRFYLALAYFKAEDPRARATLEAVGENNPDYGVRVGRMLQLLE